MGASASLSKKKQDKLPETEDQEESSSSDQKLPSRGILRTLGFKRSAVALPHEGSWLEVTIFEAKNLPAADDNGLSDPYVEINLGGDSSSRKTVVRKKTLNPRWQQPLLLEVRSDRAVGELTKKGEKKACYWFTPGTTLFLQV